MVSAGAILIDLERFFSNRRLKTFFAIPVPGVCDVFFCRHRCCHCAIGCVDGYYSTFGGHKKRPGTRFSFHVSPRVLPLLPLQRRLQKISQARQTSTFPRCRTAQLRTGSLIDVLLCNLMNRTWEVRNKRVLYHFTYPELVGVSLAS